MPKRQRNIAIAASVLLLALIPIQVLNFTGFCYSEFRYLSERELVDRHLFGKDAAKFSEEEKAARFSQLHSGGEYPACCRVDESNLLSPFAKAVNRFLGNYLYELQYTYPRDADDIARHDSNDPYYEKYVTLNSCGSETGDNSGIVRSLQSYRGQIERNLNHWKGSQG